MIIHHLAGMDLDGVSAAPSDKRDSDAAPEERSNSWATYTSILESKSDCPDVIILTGNISPEESKLPHFSECLAELLDSSSKRLILILALRCPCTTSSTVVSSTATGLAPCEQVAQTLRPHKNVLSVVTPISHPEGHDLFHGKFRIRVSIISDLLLLKGTETLQGAKSYLEENIRATRAAIPLTSSTDLINSPSELYVTIVNTAHADIAGNSGSYYPSQGLRKWGRDNNCSILLYGPVAEREVTLEHDLIRDKATLLIGTPGPAVDRGKVTISEIRFDVSNCRLDLCPIDLNGSHTPGKVYKLPLTALTAVPPPSAHVELEKLLDHIETIKLDPSSYEHEIKKIIRILMGASNESVGIDEPFIRELKMHMDNPAYNKLFFTDALGAEAWLNPEFAVHLAQQIRHYTVKNMRIVTNKNGGSEVLWSLKFDPLIKNAILTCRQNREKLKTELEDMSSGISAFRHEGQFSIFETPEIEKEEKNPPGYHIVRILIWPEEDLAKEAAHALIQLHKIVFIPLFYIPYGQIEHSPIGANCRYEYDIFVSPDYSEFMGHYYDTKDPSRSRHHINESSIPYPPPAKREPHIPYPLENYKKLLRHSHIYLAEDYREFYLSTKAINEEES